MSTKITAKILFSLKATGCNVNNGKTGKVIRRGPNYIIALGEDNKIFRSWVKDLQEHSIL